MHMLGECLSVDEPIDAKREARDKGDGEVV
jgi:hypothetical protein